MALPKESPPASRDISRTGRKNEGISIQGDKWNKFSADVSDHIENYVIAQYGDEDEEPAQEYDAADCVKQAQRYLARFGKSQREGEELRDMLKAAHWIQKAADRLS